MKTEILVFFRCALMACILMACSSVITNYYTKKNDFLEQENIIILTRRGQDQLAFDTIKRAHIEACSLDLLRNRLAVNPSDPSDRFYWNINCVSRVY